MGTWMGSDWAGWGRDGEEVAVQMTDWKTEEHWDLKHMGWSWLAHWRWAREWLVLSNDVSIDFDSVGSAVKNRLAGGHQGSG